MYEFHNAHLHKICIRLPCIALHLLQGIRKLFLWMCPKIEGGLNNLNYVYLNSYEL